MDQIEITAKETKVRMSVFYWSVRELSCGIAGVTDCRGVAGHIEYR